MKMIGNERKMEGNGTKMHWKINGHERKTKGNGRKCK